MSNKVLLFLSLVSATSLVASKDAEMFTGNGEYLWLFLLCANLYWLVTDGIKVAKEI